jgi:uncharacterized damage-inducible protein DinB
MDALARPIVALYELSKNILATSVKDLSDLDAKARIRAGAGPSVAWTVGHLCHHKVQALGLLGQSHDNPFAALFESTPASDGSNYPTLTELMASFSALNAELCPALASASARLDSPMPGAGPHDEKKVLDTILFLAWHEAYHIGNIGAIRKALGRKAISDLVMGG